MGLASYLIWVRQFCTPTFLALTPPRLSRNGSERREGVQNAPSMKCTPKPSERWFVLQPLILNLIAKRITAFDQEQPCDFCRLRPEIDIERKGRDLR